jgi:translation initiation factor IF-1
MSSFQIGCGPFRRPQKYPTFPASRQLKKGLVVKTIALAESTEICGLLKFQRPSGEFICDCRNDPAICRIRSGKKTKTRAKIKPIFVVILGTTKYQRSRCGIEQAESKKRTSMKLSKTLCASFWIGHLTTAAARPPNERLRLVSRP